MQEIERDPNKPLKSTLSAYARSRCRDDPARVLDELAELVGKPRIEIAGREIVTSGSHAALFQSARARRRRSSSARSHSGAKWLLFDAQLAPAQQRNLRNFSRSPSSTASRSSSTSLRRPDSRRPCCRLNWARADTFCRDSRLLEPLEPPARRRRDCARRGRISERGRRPHDARAHRPPQGRLAEVNAKHPRCSGAGASAIRSRRRLSWDPRTRAKKPAFLTPLTGSDVSSR